MTSPTAENQIITNGLLTDLIAAIGTLQTNFLAATEAQRLEVVEVAARVEQQRIDTLAATEAVAAAVEVQRLHQVEALKGLPH